MSQLACTAMAQQHNTRIKLFQKVSLFGTRAADQVRGTEMFGTEKQFPIQYY